VIKALAEAPRDVRLYIAGTGTQRDVFERLAASLGLGDRVRFLGEIDDDTLIELYAGALAVIYPPFDEDFGYVTLEAFLSKKPVITTRDAGEPAFFVIDGVTGRVTDPDPAAIGAAIADLHARPDVAARLGEAGYEQARRITWTAAIERLVEGL
jgi:glycosyltransferase involved in cell wall biosynthesis